MISKIKELVILLFISLNLSGQIKIEYKLSRVFGLVQFVEHLGNHRGTGQVTRKIFSDSRFVKDTSLTNAMAKFSEIDFGSRITYEGFPENHKLSADAWNFFVIAASNAENLKELEMRSYGLFPAETHKQVMGVIREFESVYDEVIWKPCMQKTSENLQKIKELAEKKQLDVYFNKICKFYGTTWNPEVPFRVMFYPVPGKQGFSATPKGNVIACGLLTDDNNFDGVLGVVFHEMSHILYDEQPMKLQNDLERWFKGNTPFHKQAYLWFNESVATMCGNGYVYKKLTGAEDKSDWYDNTYINRQAKAAYKLSESYIENNKTIDSNYVTSFIKMFETEFDTAYSEYKNIFAFTDVVLLAEEGKTHEFSNLFFSNYDIRNYGMETGSISDESVKNMTNGIKTRVIVVGENHAKNIELLRSQINVLKTVKLNPNADYVYSFFDKNGSPFVIVNLRDWTKLSKLFSVFREQKNIIDTGFRQL